MKDRIKILLIDDNPEYAFSEKKDISQLPELIIEDESYDEIPWISSDNYIRQPEIFKQLRGVEDFFEIRWLQFPLDAYEYRKLSNKVKLSYGMEVLNNVGYVPDIIIFDYALTDMNEENPSDYLHFLKKNPELNRFINPNVKLANYISEIEKIKIHLPGDDEYDDDNYPLNDSNTKNIDAIMDSYGLYCGSFISEMYKYDAPLASIPVTRKSKVKISQEPEPAFLEWFINNSYYKVFDRSKRTDKDWNSILSDSLIVLRKEIIENIKLGKIILNYNNLIDIAGTNNNDIEKKTLKYKSIYGQREIPIQGLFIDCSIGKVTEELNEEFSKFDFVDPTIRQVEIFKFISEILDIVTLNLSLAEIKEAEAAAKQLLTVFDGPLFTQRIMLSELHRKHINKEKLDKEDIRTYKELLKIFTISDNKITNVTPFTISELGSKGRNKNIPFNKLIVSFAAINLLKRWDTFMDNIIKEDSLYNDYNNQPTESMVQPDINDLLLLLFPIWTEHIILFNDKGSIKKNVRDTFQSKLKTLVNAKFKDLKSEVNGIDLSKFLSKGELYLVSIYAESLNFRIPNTLKWIKNGNK